MWAVLFLLSCIINSIGCSIFDENHASEYDDFHDGSYSHSEDDADYEDEYNDPASTEPPRVRRYDRMTHTVPAPVLTIGLPEVKDALQMLMLGRNLSSTDIKDLESGRSQFVYPIEMNFNGKVSNENAIKPTPIDESLEIPIEFYEIKITKKESAREKSTRLREHPMEPPRTYFKDPPTRVDFTHTTAKQYTIDRSTNKATIKKPTRSDFIDIKHEMIPFDTKNMMARNRLKIFKNNHQEEDDNIVDEPIKNSVKEPIIPPQHALRELMLGRYLSTRYENPPVNVCHTTVKIDAEYIDGPTIIQIEPTISTYIDALRELMLGRYLCTRYKNRPVNVSHTTVEIDGEYIDEPTITQNESTFSTYIGKRLNRQEYDNVRATKPNYMELSVKMKPVMKTKDKTINVESTLYKLKHKQNNVEYYIIEGPNENKNTKDVQSKDFDEQIDKIKNADRKLIKNTSANPTRNEIVEKKTEIEYIIGRPTKTLSTKPTRNKFFERVNEEVFVFEKPTENVAQETTRHNDIENKIEMKYMIQKSTETITIMKPTRVEYTGQTNAITHNTKLEKPTRNQIISDMPKGFQSTPHSIFSFIKQPTESELEQNVNTDEETVTETIVEKPLDLAHITLNTSITSDDLFDEPIIQFVPYKPLTTEFTFEATSDSLLEKTSVTNKNKFNKYSKQLTEEEYKIEGPISINPSIVGLLSRPFRVESQKTSTSNKLLEIILTAYSNRTEVSVTDKKPKLQKTYYYDDSKSGTELVYIETNSAKENLPRTPPGALQIQSKAETFQTVFLYDNEVPEDGIILRMENDKEDDEDRLMLAGNWSEEYDPLEFLLTNESVALRQGVTQQGGGTQDGGNTTTTQETKKTRKSKKPKKTVSTTTAYPFDVEKFLEMVANLTYDYYTNLTEQLNMTLIKLGAPTCRPPTTTVTTTTRYTGFIRPDYSIMENKIMGKCYVCGLVDEGIPWNAHCSDAFAGDFLPLSPVDASAKGQLAKYRKYCRYDDVDHYVQNETTPRTIYGRWTGGCGVRWTDISSVYTQRTCRNRNHPTTGKHYASKRMSKLEMTLVNVDNGCIASPIASLIPLSRGISLYARFHACVCTGSWCNVSWRLDSDSDVWKAYVIVGLLLVLR